MIPKAHKIYISFLAFVLCLEIAPNPNTNFCQERHVWLVFMIRGKLFFHVVPIWIVDLHDGWTIPPIEFWRNTKNNARWGHFFRVDGVWVECNTIQVQHFIPIFTQKHIAIMLSFHHRRQQISKLIVRLLETSDWKCTLLICSVHLCVQKLTGGFCTTFYPHIH